MAKKRKKEEIGECRICGKQGKLSFEHVPNQAAFNKTRVIQYSATDKLLQPEKRLKGRIRQKGMGDHTLCVQCNNDTGHWYGDEYTSWARIAFDFLSKRKPSTAGPDEAELILHNVYPLRFLKQAIVCFFSVTPGLAQSHPALVKFVLDKYEQHMPQDCRVFLSFYYGEKPKLRRWPLSAKMQVTIGPDDTIRVGQASIILSEMSHPPFALELTDGTRLPGAGEITSFKQLGYDQQMRDLTLRLQVWQGESLYPGSFH